LCPRFSLSIQRLTTMIGRRVRIPPPGDRF